MPETVAATAQHPPATQLTDLCLLVDLEARWENLRIRDRTPSSRTASTREELHQKQKAYEAFLAKLVAYNKQYKPAHVPELLLNNPRRLGLWCQRMRVLHQQIQNDPKSRYPEHLMEKAYLRADRLADRIKKDRITRPVREDNIQAAIRDLEGLAHWCDTLASISP